MISCHDLRTGNIILVNNRLRKVTLISNSQTLTDQSIVGVESLNYDETEQYPAADIQPVPINEAILAQSNFTYQAKEKYWQLVNDDESQPAFIIDAGFSLLDNSRRPVLKNIASLHELQNVHYLFLKKELHFDVDTTMLVDGEVRGAANNR